MSYNTPASAEQIARAVSALKANGISAVLAADGNDAKNKVLAMTPSGANVMTMTSITLDSLGIPEEINDSGKFDSVRAKYATMDPKVQAKEMRMMGAAPEYVIGSVHAVTEDGKILIASNTGSQLPAYVYGAGKVIWVVGTQKIVPNLDEAMKRLNEYVLPLESERANKAYNITSGSFVSKLLLVNREIQPDRITIIFVPEVIGF